MTSQVYRCVSGGCGNRVSGPGGMCGRCTSELAALARQRAEKRDKAATRKARVISRKDRRR